MCEHLLEESHYRNWRFDNYGRVKNKQMRNRLFKIRVRGGMTEAEAEAYEEHLIDVGWRQPCDIDRARMRSERQREKAGLETTSEDAWVDIWLRTMQDLEGTNTRGAWARSDLHACNVDDLVQQLVAECDEETSSRS